MAPAIFQRAMDKILKGIPHVVSYVDESLLTGINDNNHLKNLAEVLTRLELKGARFKKFKCTFFSSTVSWSQH